MLDELCAVARDLLILRNGAEGAAIQMISGICTDAGAAGRCCRCSARASCCASRPFCAMPAAGFNASANRRIDAELCLMRLCEPEAQSGCAVAQCAPEPRGGEAGRAAVVPALPCSRQREELAPPGRGRRLRDGRQRRAAGDRASRRSRPCRSARADGLLAGVWSSGCTRRSSRSADAAMFSTRTTRRCAAQLHGRPAAAASTDTEFAVRALVNKPKVLQTGGGCVPRPCWAQPVRGAQCCTEGQSSRTAAALNELMSFGAEHPELVS